MKGMTTLLALDSSSAAQHAFARLFTVAAWVARRGDEFSFREVAAALGGAYAGSADAVDRRWSRDKFALGELGVDLSCDGGRYVCAPARRHPSGLTGARAAALAAVVRDLPAGDEYLERGLRKLLAHGAPILGALMTRAARERQFVVRDSTPRMLSLAYLLVVLLEAAGEGGLSVDEAVVAIGARDRDELERVVGLLSALKLPFDAPDDGIPVLLEGERVELYSLVPILPLPGFTAEERKALADVGAGVADAEPLAA